VYIRKFRPAENSKVSNARVLLRLWIRIPASRVIGRSNNLSAKRRWRDDKETTMVMLEVRDSRL
jgi:hypothetical protein